jgi:four helix bundle protein
MNYFRFEDIQIWQEAIELGDQLFDVSELAEEKKLFRFAEQLRGAGMSISNNISEGAGSFSDKEFRHFLNIARRSTFECANIIIIYTRRRIINEDLKMDLLSRLSSLSKRITSFRKSIS